LLLHRTAITATTAVAVPLEVVATVVMASTTARVRR
jgi:hypothetical protein